MSQLLNSALVTGGAEVPEGHYAEENMKSTVVPNRNKIFLLFKQLLCQLLNLKEQTVKLLWEYMLVIMLFILTVAKNLEMLILKHLNLS